MKSSIKNGVAREINPYTDKAAKSAFERSVVKFRVFQADGETPFPNTREIDSIEFTKVFKTDLKRKVLVHKSQAQLEHVKLENEWIPIAERPLIQDEGEVLAFHPNWICEDFNPNGTRVGFISGGGEFISAFWWDYQDTYVNKQDIMPTHYRLIPSTEHLIKTS